MNSVELTGRLTKDPDVRYTGSGMAIGRFTLAVDRQRSAKEGEQAADFIGITCFGKTAELIEKYVKKGRLVGISGRIQTGYYERDNKRVYTTDIVANRVEFLSRNPEDTAKTGPAPVPIRTEPSVSDEERKAIAAAADESPEIEIPEGFEKLSDEDIPF